MALLLESASSDLDMNPSRGGTLCFSASASPHVMEGIAVASLQLHGQSGCNGRFSLMNAIVILEISFCRYGSGGARMGKVLGLPIQDWYHPSLQQ
jgi:hypothetical protein